MNRLACGLLQTLVALAFIALIAAFGQGPGFAPVPTGHGELKISVAHLAGRLEPCRSLSEEEQQRLPPTRRVIEVCERGRAPTEIRLTLNNEVLINELIQPAGWHGDGRAYFLQFLPLPAGQHQLELTLRDRPHDGLYELNRQFDLNLAPGDSVLLAIGDGDITLRRTPPRLSENPS